MLVWHMLLKACVGFLRLIFVAPDQQLMFLMGWSVHARAFASPIAVLVMAWLFNMPDFGFDRESMSVSLVAQFALERHLSLPRIDQDFRTDVQTGS